MQIKIRSVRFGLILALFSILSGYFLGATFGFAEKGMKDRLKASAETVRESVYKGDQGKIDKTLDKSFKYLIRAHLHAGAIGTAALAQIILLLFLGAPEKLKAAAAFMLGLGALGYSWFWFFAGLKAPSLGGTGAAKESLAWLGQPTSALVILGTLLVVGMAIREVFSPAPDSGSR